MKLHSFDKGQQKANEIFIKVKYHANKCIPVKYMKHGQSVD